MYLITDFTSQGNVQRKRIRNKDTEYASTIFTEVYYNMSHYFTQKLHTPMGVQ